MTPAMMANIRGVIREYHVTLKNRDKDSASFRANVILLSNIKYLSKFEYGKASHDTKHTCSC